MRRVAATAIALVFIGAPAARAQAASGVAPVVADVVAQQVRALMPDDGAAVAVRHDGKTEFYNVGAADRARNRPVTSDSLFNLASIGKLFASILLAQAVKQDELRLDDPIAKSITELQQGGDIRRVTYGELASHTSGLPRVPEQYERWHKGPYAPPDFTRFLNSWKADPQHEPGRQDIYSNAAFVLLRVALARRFATPFATLMEQRLTGPLGMTSTVLAPLTGNGKDRLLAAAVQGYGPMGRPVGQPGEDSGNAFTGDDAGQIFSSARDMAIFLTANLGELPGHQPLQAAMAFAQQGVFKVNDHFTQGLAWQIVSAGKLTIVDKNGGLQNTSTYIGLVPQRKLGIVILANRGRQPATKVGRAILQALAEEPSAPVGEGDGGEPD